MPPPFNFAFCSPPGLHSVRPKVHTLLDYNRYIPAFAAITNIKNRERPIGLAMELAKGYIIVFEKGFISYLWFPTLGEKTIFFVTRLKKNVWKTIEPSDHIIEKKSCNLVV